MNTPALGPERFSLIKTNEAGQDAQAGLDDVHQATQTRVDALVRDLEHARDLSTQLDRLDEYRVHEQAIDELSDLLAEIAGDSQQTAHLDYLSSQARAQAEAIAETLALMSSDLTMPISGVQHHEG